MRCLSRGDSRHVGGAARGEGGLHGRHAALEHGRRLGAPRLQLLNPPFPSLDIGQLHGILPGIAAEGDQLRHRVGDVALEGDKRRGGLRHLRGGQLELVGGGLGCTPRERPEALHLGGGGHAIDGGLAGLLRELAGSVDLPAHVVEILGVDLPPALLGHAEHIHHRPVLRGLDHGIQHLDVHRGEGPRHAQEEVRFGLALDRDHRRGLVDRVVEVDIQPWGGLAKRRQDHHPAACRGGMPPSGARGHDPWDGGLGEGRLSAPESTRPPGQRGGGRPQGRQASGPSFREAAGASLRPRPSAPHAIQCNSFGAPHGHRHLYWRARPLGGKRHCTFEVLR
mmetsp:Transcript_26918/g.86476  ORF Transcript_26918/g.86476 Transcript_26918/m.86476 type:complete len:337 (+) Transcript_26918:1361-2371(+)